jgi:hypothetical protein
MFYEDVIMRAQGNWWTTDDIMEDLAKKKKIWKDALELL